MMSGTGGTFATGELHALADLLANLTPGALPVDHLDQLEALERVKSAAAAAQAGSATTSPSRWPLCSGASSPRTNSSHSGS